MLSDYFDLPSLMNLETPYIPESHLVVPDLFAPYPYSVLPNDMALSYGLTTDAARQPLVDAIEAEDAGDGAAFMDRDIHELWHRHKLVGVLAMTGKLQALTAYYDVMLSFEGIFIPSHLRGQGLGRALAQHLGEVLAAFITEQFEFALSWGKGIRVFLAVSRVNLRPMRAEI